MAFRSQSIREQCIECRNLTDDHCAACEAPSCAVHGWGDFCEACKQILDQRLAQEGLSRGEMNFDGSYLHKGNAAWNEHTHRVYRTRFIVDSMRTRYGRRMR